MRVRHMALAALLLLWGAALPAQEFAPQRDFLTDHEIDLIREAQEPNERIKRYLHFASLRMELIQQLMAQEEPGRGAKIHRNLQELARIIDAIDLVIDDAVVDDVDLELGLTEVTTLEPQLLAKLEKIQQSAPDDLWRYEFALEDVIDVIGLSLELAQEDLGDRKRDVMEADARREAQRQATMSAARAAEVKKGKEKEARKETEFQQKRPTLYKPGEKPGDERKP